MDVQVNPPEEDQATTPAAEEASSPVESAGTSEMIASPPAATNGLPADDMPRTPISSLMTSIEKGFLLTPGEPLLSPPANYSNLPIATGAFGFGFGVQGAQLAAKPVSVGFGFGIHSALDENDSPAEGHNPFMKGDLNRDLRREALSEMEGNTWQ
jgi:hypothetical protein